MHKKRSIFVAPILRLDANAHLAPMQEARQAIKTIAISSPEDCPRCKLVAVAHKKTRNERVHQSSLMNAE
ncbi:hypothetical protein L596_025493 [Steinernema carpocapsae]|uniref:Uncharacterized protein n=1 Tax=Steinernema carpocapsae TaxID=34508 RepID=A0A4U5M7X4_STECR|nr:hypothetical protein L596_025493 [Steinernema carpocapsae]